jgi:hypothetical protein
MMGWGTRENFDRRSKLLREHAPYAQQNPSRDLEKLVEGSMMLAAAIWRTKKVYRKMSAEEMAEFERYAAGAVKVNIVKKKGVIG